MSKRSSRMLAAVTDPREVVATKPDLNALRPHARQPLHPTQLCAALRPPRLTSPDLSSGSTAQLPHSHTVATAPEATAPEATTGTGDLKRLRTEHNASSRSVTFGENTIVTFEAEDIVQKSVALAAASEEDASDVPSTQEAGASPLKVASNLANMDNRENQAQPLLPSTVKGAPMDENNDFAMPAPRPRETALASAPTPGLETTPVGSLHAATLEMPAQPGGTSKDDSAEVTSTFAAAAAATSIAASVVTTGAATSAATPPEDAEAVEACLLAVMREHADAELNPKQVRTLCEQSLGGGRSLAACKDWVRQTIYALRDRYFADDDDEEEEYEGEVEHPEQEAMVHSSSCNSNVSGTDDPSSSTVATPAELFEATTKGAHSSPTHRLSPSKPSQEAATANLLAQVPTPSLSPSPPVPLLRDRCFALPDAVTSVALAPDGWCVLCCHRSGTVRLYSLLDSSASLATSGHGASVSTASHRSSSKNSNSGTNSGQWGYELGSVDASCLQRMDLHMEVSSDGERVFVGARLFSTKLVSWSLKRAKELLMSNGKLTPHCLDEAHEPSTLRHSSPKLRGLGAVGTMAPGREYRLLTGLGYCTLNLWQVRLTPGRWSPPGLHSSDHDISATTNLSATASSSTTSTTTSSTNTVSMTAEWTPIFSKNCGGQIFLTHFAFLDNCQRFLSKNNVKCVRVWEITDESLLNTETNSSSGTQVRDLPGTAAATHLVRATTGAAAAAGAAAVAAGAAAGGPTGTSNPWSGFVYGPTELNDGCFMQPVPTAGATAATAAPSRVDLALDSATAGDLRGVNLSSGKIMGVSENGCEVLALRADGVLLHFQLGDSLKALSEDSATTELSSSSSSGSNSDHRGRARPIELLRVPGEGSACGAILAAPSRGVSPLVGSSTNSGSGGGPTPPFLGAPLAAIAVHFNHASDGVSGSNEGRDAQARAENGEEENTAALVCYGLLKVQSLPPDPRSAAAAAAEAAAASSETSSSSSAISSSPERRAALLAKRRAQWAMEKHLKGATETAVTGLKAFADVTLHLEETLHHHQQNQPAGLSTLQNWSLGGTCCWMCAHPGSQHWDQPGMASNKSGSKSKDSSKSSSKSANSNNSRGGALVKVPPVVQPAAAAAVESHARPQTAKMTSSSTGLKSKAKASKRRKVTASSHEDSLVKGNPNRGDGLDDSDDDDEDVVEFISRVSDAKPHNEAATADVQHRSSVKEVQESMDPKLDSQSLQPNAKRSLAMPEAEAGNEASSLMLQATKMEEVSEAAKSTVLKSMAAARAEKVAAVKAAKEAAKAAEKAEMEEKMAAARKQAEELIAEKEAMAEKAAAAKAQEKATAANAETHAGAAVATVAAEPAAPHALIGQKRPADSAAAAAAAASASASSSASPPSSPPVPPYTAREEALMAENASLLAEKASMVKDVARMNVARERQFEAKKLLRKVSEEKEAKLRARVHELEERLMILESGGSASMDEQALKQVRADLDRTYALAVDRNDAFKAALAAAQCTSTSPSSLLSPTSRTSPNGRVRPQCVTCKSAVATVALVPCGHMCLCQRDSDALKERAAAAAEAAMCPLCNQRIEGFDDTVSL